jgi:hypothetical protein
LTGVTSYHGAVLRFSVLAARLLPVCGVVLLGVVLLGGCGEPPQPLPTAPPPDFRDPSSVPSGTAYPSGLPSMPGYPTATTGGYPTYPAYPTYPVSTPSRTVSPTPTGPPPAPKCTKGPTAAQVLAVVKGKPGIPANAQLVVKAGPYCAGTWQFSTVGEAGSDVDPLQVVTNGKPAALNLVEYGADVCSDHVHDTAPVGIRVWACGS